MKVENLGEYEVCQQRRRRNNNRQFYINIIAGGGTSNLSTFTLFLYFFRINLFIQHKLSNFAIRFE